MASAAQSPFARDLLGALRRLRSSAARVHIPPARDLKRRRRGSHFHATPELFIQTGGATDFDCPGGRFRLRAGEVCVMPRGVPHAESPVDLSTPYEIVVCMQSRDGLFLQRANTGVDHRIQACSTTHLVGGRPRDAFRYLDEIAVHHTISAPQRKGYVRALLEVFLITTFAELQRFWQTEPAAGSPLVVEVEKLARTRLADPHLTVSSLAAALGCSPDHLTRKFRWERGLSPKAWIVHERVAQAIDLLADARHNVAEVGWACGFNEPSYFIRVFHRLTGVTPRAFRSRLAHVV